jgi:hypothetical protein
MLPIDVRLLLRRGGFDPLPLAGKRPVLEDWPHLSEVPDPAIEAWSRRHPLARNTGILTRLAPTLDIDIFNVEVVSAMERAIEDLWSEHGEVLVRIGRPPKRAILFRTDEPFGKLQVHLIAPDDPTGARGEKLEFLGDGQQVVVHGVHPDTGKPYAWPLGSPKERGDLPYIREAEARGLLEKLTEIAAGHGYQVKAEPRPRANGPENPGPVDWSLTRLIEHEELTATGMKLVRAGMHPGAAVNFLKEQLRGLEGVDEERRKRRLAEVADIVSSAQDKLEEAEALAKPRLEPGSRPGHGPRSLAEVLAVFDKWLELKSPWPVYAVLGAVAANLLPGDPVWLGLIAPSSSAKTEILNSLTRLPHIVEASVLTSAALLSGTDRKRHAKEAKGGLLREVGEQGILVMKDYGSLLSMRTETRGEVMAALREVYDGHWVRRIGTEGGRTLEWRGKLGLIFAATPIYDDHHAVIGGLGERNLLYRFGTRDRADTERQFVKALAQTGDWRDEIATAVAGLFQDLRLVPAHLSEAERLGLHQVVDLVARLRAHVERHRYSREIESVQPPEGPGRISKALQQLLAGLLIIGVEREAALALLQEIALASVSNSRRKVFELLSKEPITTREVAERIGLPTTTTRRTLEDLAAVKLCLRRRSMGDDGEEKQGGADTWTLA